MLIAYTQKHVILPQKQIGDKVRMHLLSPLECWSLGHIQRSLSMDRSAAAQSTTSHPTH